MILCDYLIRVKNRGAKISIIPIGDTHDGVKNFDLLKLKKVVDWIRYKENAYWLGMGDYCEFIGYTDDKRFDPKAIDPQFYGDLDNLHFAQIKHISDLLKPIGHKCIGLLEGNHENTIHRKCQTDATDIIAYNLKTRNLGFVTFIRLFITRIKAPRKGVTQVVKIYATHGWGGGRLIGADLNALQALSKDFDADIYLSGHTHKKGTANTERLDVIGRMGNPTLIQRKRILGKTGSFYRTYLKDVNSYAEKNGSSPLPTGVIKVIIEPFRQEYRDGRYIELPPHIHVTE